MKNKILIYAFSLLALSSCILPKKYNVLAEKETTFNNTVDSLNDQISALKTNLSTEQDARISLEQDTIKLAREYKILNYKYLNNISGGTSDATRFVRRIDDARQEITTLRKRIDEYERKIKYQEISITNFNNLVTTFIMSFPNDGIKMKSYNDRIVLTIDDALLFEPGGYMLTVESADLISYLASFLARNKEIKALIVSNTDPSDTLNANDVFSNNDVDSTAVNAKNIIAPSTNFEAWELSVKRSTEILREIFKNKSVIQSNVTAAGKGCSSPVTTKTDDYSKSQNRRTEIILTK
ncbi:MAG: hypothetical protein R3Y26_01970 [Rikenellaceae bacterium]